VFALGLANTVGMSTIGLLLVLAVRRHAGAAALAGLARAAGAGIVAAVVAALAGRGVVVALASGATPTTVGSLLQGMLGGVTVAAGYAATTYLLDRPDVRPLLAALARRVRRTTAKEGTG
jgi:putative peptidoglycan lipid II flippase